VSGTGSTGIKLQQQVDRDPAVLATTLAAWLADALAWDGVVVASVSRSASGGSANETLLVQLDGGPSGTPREVVVRLNVPSVEVYFDADMRRQALVIAWVRANSDVPVPRVLGVEPSGDVLGGSFMVMERSPGQAAPDYPGYNIEGFLADASPAGRRSLWWGAFDTMCRIGLIDPSASEELISAGVPAAAAGLVDHWRRSLEWMSARIDGAPYLPIFDWLDEHLPTEAPTGFSWGDARVANMLFVGDHTVCVLDWEMASFGGPLVDLAWWLMFDRIQSDDLGVGRLEGLPNRPETIERWQRQTGLPATALAWFEVLAHLELALTRAHVYAQRASRGLPTPTDDDPRAVGRLTNRIEAIMDGREPS
jgi:aminoglycoside phosphotransferase (APT) family kinase protein